MKPKNSLEAHKEEKGWKNYGALIGTIVSLLAIIAFIFQFILIPLAENEAKKEYLNSAISIKSYYEGQINNLKTIINQKENDLINLNNKLIELENQKLKDWSQIAILNFKIARMEEQIIFYKETLDFLQIQQAQTDSLIKRSDELKKSADTSIPEISFNGLNKAYLQIFKETDARLDSCLKKLISSLEDKILLARLRSIPKVGFDQEDQNNMTEYVETMIKKYDFYDSTLNVNGCGFPNKFESIILNGDTVIHDYATGLMWQKGGLGDGYSGIAIMGFSRIESRIGIINRKQYAGFSDWRLPTLDECMSLMEAEKNNRDLHIDPVFDKKQYCIWTSDNIKSYLARSQKAEANRRRQNQSRAVVLPYAWIVNYRTGKCELVMAMLHGYFIRAVRSGQSS